MNRLLHRWLLFAVCLAVLLAAMGWTSVTTLRLDRAQREAAQQAEQEERARLALWRMDSALTALFVEESARPANAYQAFYEAERAYAKEDNVQFKKGQVLVPSPLLAFASSNILLHFQREPDGTLTTPQVPAGPQRELALAGYTSAARLDAFAARLNAMDTLLRQPAQRGSGYPPVASAAKAARLLNGDVLMRESGAPATGTAQGSDAQTLLAANLQRQADVPQKGKQSQAFLNTAEMQSRANLYQQAAQQAVLNANPDQQPQSVSRRAPEDPGGGGVVFKALWLGEELLLARRVPMEGRLVVQACWLNWTNLHDSLLASIRDLFPDANLKPLPQPAGDTAARRLAALPVELVAGPLPATASNGWSPVQVTLAVAWGCVLLAALAWGFLLHGTLALSERRAAFVSAVTHELRTPLTTFKMYSEMLAEDMVPDAEKRKSYLATLCSEAGRLSHLVENVLAYARLERGNARRRVERVTLGDLIERVKPRLVQRLDQAGMRLVTDSDAPALRTVVHADVSAVEQILFNLADNACKYAATDGAEKTVHLEALPADGKGKFAMLRVRDHGQGISAEAARRLFQPFSKSASEAARTAPGVGLGLALCRRLSRSLGGELRWDSSVHDGACFVLALPVREG